MEVIATWGEVVVVAAVTAINFLLVDVRIHYCRTAIGGGLKLHVLNRKIPNQNCSTTTLIFIRTPTGLIEEEFGEQLKGLHIVSN
jgi:hypothetical protein